MLSLQDLPYLLVTSIACPRTSPPSKISSRMVDGPTLARRLTCGTNPGINQHVWRRTPRPLRGGTLFLRMLMPCHSLPPLKSCHNTIFRSILSYESFLHHPGGTDTFGTISDLPPLPLFLTTFATTVPRMKWMKMLERKIGENIFLRTTLDWISPFRKPSRLFIGTFKQGTLITIGCYGTMSSRPPFARLSSCKGSKREIAVAAAVLPSSDS